MIRSFESKIILLYSGLVSISLLRRSPEEFEVMLLRCGLGSGPIHEAIVTGL